MINDLSSSKVAQQMCVCMRHSSLHPLLRSYSEELWDLRDILGSNSIIIIKNGKEREYLNVGLIGE
jgi:hypothetical protein